MFQLLRTRYSVCLLIILCFSFVTRIYQLSSPSTYVFDEVYHAVTAKLIARDDVRAYEWWNEPVEPNTAVDWLHPPLAKYFQAAGISIFGENSFGWRISSVLFGVLVVAAVAKLSLLLFKDKILSLIAALLTSLDGLLLVQSRIAMNDIHVTFFILLTLIIYTKHRLLSIKKITHVSPYLFLTGVTAGLAMGSKWSGIFVLLPIGIFELFSLLQRSRSLTYIQTLQFLLQRFLLLVIMPLTVYVLCYSHMFLQGKTLVCMNETSIQGQCYYEEFKNFSGTDVIWRGYVSHFIELHRQIWWYQTTLDAEHPYQSRPWQWFLNARPVWYYVDYQTDSRADIYALGNSLIFWTGGLAVVTSVIGLSHKAFRTIQRQKNDTQKLRKEDVYLIFLLLAYCAVWLPWQLSPRIMFFYHYTPAVPLLCLILAYYLTQLLKSRSGISRSLGYCILCLACITFAVFYPHWIGVPVETDWKDNLFFAVESWR